MPCEMIVTLMRKNWVREECLKCGRVVEYYGRQLGTPAKYVGKWVGRKPNSKQAGGPFCNGRNNEREAAELEKEG